MTQPTTKEDGTQDPELYEYHRALIEEGIREADAGDVWPGNQEHAHCGYFGGPN